MPEVSGSPAPAGSVTSAGAAWRPGIASVTRAASAAPKPASTKALRKAFSLGTEAGPSRVVIWASTGAADLDGFGYLDRQSGGQNGRVAGYEVAVSDDGGNWTTVARGTLADSPRTQTVDFPEVRASYVRFTALNALNGQPFAAAAELRAYGAYADAPVGYPPV
ncbi:discoidin domain-containing protein [Streptomyces sp. V4-01]|uniref:Discoidin domain-containing protein n=1 Tax=Actinacidiphila polyblastidii TaxID=3110430 RepID=A0ABU7P8Z5_9ACTN|nr:discoidin domain-containing protein [Streptomyces sp. V4-01]